MNYWIFQGNPKTFDVDGYLAKNSIILWSINQSHYSNDIERGDLVFIWRSDGKDKESGGIVASGEILDSPSIFSEPEESLAYWINADDRLSASKPSMRVSIRLSQVRTAPKQVIKRKWVENDPVLRKLRIVKMRSETNYKIKLKEATRIIELLERTGEDWTTQEVLAALKVYSDTRGKSISKTAGSRVSNLALMTGRAVDGCYNKIMNIRAIDPTDQRQGLSSGSHVDLAIWHRYFDKTSNSLNIDRLNKDYFLLWGKATDKQVSEGNDAPNDQVGKKVLRQINVRRGQRKFRENLLNEYSNRCAVTGCGIINLLEAAHIVPHASTGINSIENGLLLRADIHTLFDLGLLFIHPETYQIGVSTSLDESPYIELSSINLRATNSGKYPKKEYLNTHYRTRDI